MAQKSTVTDPNVPAVSPETGGNSEVPQGTPAQGSGDAAPSLQDLQARLEAAQEQISKLEADRRKQQAALQSQAARDRKALEDQLAATKTQLTSKLSAEEKAQFDFAELQRQVETYRDQAAALQQQIEVQKQTNEFLQAYREMFGIEPTGIDTSSPDVMVSSAFARLQEEITALRAGQKPAPQQTPKPSEQRPTPGPTISGSGQPPATRPTIVELRSQLATNLNRPDLTLGDVYDMFERGEIDLNQLIK